MCCLNVRLCAQDSTTVTVPNTDSIRQVQLQDSLALVARTDSLAQVRKDSLIRRKSIDSLAYASFQQRLRQNSIATPKGNKISVIEFSRAHTDYNFEFLLFIILLLIPGVFRLTNPSYFRNTFIAFKNPNLSARHLSDQLSQNSLASLIMNAYFCLVMAAFIILLLKKFNIQHHLYFQNHWVLLILASIAIAVIYIFKAGFLKLISLVFGLEEPIEAYIFNISLLNKILAYVMLPVLAVLSFGSASWLYPAAILGICTIAIFLIQRYIRSIGSFNSLINFSKFHFFLYLCASEIIPLLILFKAISNSILR